MVTFAGVHRIQQYSGKKRHTSVVSVAVTKDSFQTIKINESDIVYETYIGSGPGGQARNKVHTAVRASHIPTGITATAEDNRSQWQNKQSARSKITARLLSISQREFLDETNTSRSSQINTNTWQWNEWRNTVSIPGYRDIQMDKALKGKFPF